jgi:hypothetical protein
VEDEKKAVLTRLPFPLVIPPTFATILTPILWLHYKVAIKLKVSIGLIGERLWNKKGCFYPVMTKERIIDIYEMIGGRILFLNESAS